jgi:hypothetical protein
MNFVNNRFSLHVNDGTHGRVLRGNRRSGIVDGDGRRKAIADGMNFEQRIENGGGKSGMAETRNDLFNHHNLEAAVWHVLCDWF